MATVTRPSTALPVAGATMSAAQVTDWITNVLSFLESTNIDEANVDLSGTDGIMGKSTTQIMTGFKTWEETSAAAGGIREVMQFGLDPVSGTSAAGDGGRLVMYADDAGGGESDLVYVDWVMAVATAASEVGRLDIRPAVAGTPTLSFSLGGVDTMLDITNPARTHTASTNAYNMYVRSSGAQTIPAGTTSLVATMRLDEPNITATGTVTSAATLYIADAPTEGGTNNHALWVVAGTTRLGGNTTFDAAIISDSTTDTTSTTTGAIQTDGGIGIAKALWVGTTSRLVGITTCDNAVAFATGVAVVASAYSIGRDADGTNQLHGNVPTGASFEFSINDVAQVVLDVTNFTTTGIINQDNTTDTSSTTTGSIHTDGGIGIAKALWVGTTSRHVGAVTFDGAIISDATTDTTSAITGAIQTDGGLGIAKALWVGTTSRLVGAVTFDGAIISDATTDTTSATTGAIQTDGGIGIAKALWVGTISTHVGVADFAAGGVTLPSIARTGDLDTGMWFPAANTVAFSTAAAERMRLDSGGLVIIGNGTTTANANMTTGLTIDQQAADNEILAFESSDVAHGMTTIAKTTVYGTFQKIDATTGGLRIAGLQESGSSVAVKPYCIAGTATATRSTSGVAPFTVTASLLSGTGTASIGADKNMVAFSDNDANTRFIFDSDGDSHQDVGTAWTNFDTETDAMILRSVGIVMDRSSIIESRFDDWARDHKEDLIRSGLIPRLTPEQEARGERPLMNTTQLLRLHNGAIWQNHIEAKELEEKIASLEMQVQRLLKERNN